MNRRALSLAVGIAAIGAALASGCSSIVRKPDINGVKKVAIVSIYADEMIPWTGGQGRIENFDTDTKHRVALRAHQAFANEFKRLKWQPVSLELVAANDLYKKDFGPQQANKDSNVLAKAANVLGTLHNSRYFSPPGLYPIQWPGKDEGKAEARLDFATFKIESKKDFKSQMADLAKTLNVDAVVLVGLDYCYTGATAVLGNGTAKLTAGSFVKAVSPSKTVVVDMPVIEKRCSGERGESDKTVAMVGGSIALGKAFAKDTLITAFDEATERSARLTVAQIEKAIHE